MIVYVSPAIAPSDYSNYVKNGVIRSGAQSQKFNSLLIEGLSSFNKVSAISNPPFINKRIEIKGFEQRVGNIRYFSIGAHSGRIRKILNFIDMRRCFRKIDKDNIQYIICDSIDVQASLTAYLYAKKNNIPIIAIVTDIPQFMCSGKMDIYGKISDYLMKKYDAYILLTEAMNSVVNLQHKPYMIMEGVCSANNVDFVRTKQNKRFTVVFTGNVSEDNNLGNLLMAFSDSRLANVDLHIYGSGSYEAKVIAASSENNNIFYHGMVPIEESVNAQRNADLLINPRSPRASFAEYSFPSKLMEYMISGVPVLTTKLPGIPNEYFNYLYTISDDSVSAIVSAIENIIHTSSISLYAKAVKAKNFILENKNSKLQAKRIIDFSETSLIK